MGALPVAQGIQSKCSSTQLSSKVGGVDCTMAVCPTDCECANTNCGDVIDTCLADATCAQAQGCALACACSDQVCALTCAQNNPSDLALPVAQDIQSKCGSTQV